MILLAQLTSSEVYGKLSFKYWVFSSIWRKMFVVQRSKERKGNPQSSNHRSMRDSLLLLLILLSCVHAGLWITLTSVSNSCSGSLVSDSYLWDTQDDGFINSNDDTCTGSYPYGQCGDNIRQYFCTGYVDSMPLGSYCFYQNRQNCNV